MGFACCLVVWVSTLVMFLAGWFGFVDLPAFALNCRCCLLFRISVLDLVVLR